MKESLLKEGAYVTVTKSKETEDGLNKFAGWESRIVKVLANGQAKITHPFMKFDMEQAIEIPTDRLKVLKYDPSEPIKAVKKGAKEPANTGVIRAITDFNAAVQPGDKIRLKKSWVTVEKASPADSKTIVTLTSEGKQKRIWREEIQELQRKA